MIYYFSFTTLFTLLMLVICWKQYKRASLAKKLIIPIGTIIFFPILVGMVIYDMRKERKQSTKA